jgi:hypothetical protein
MSRICYVEGDTGMKGDGGGPKEPWVVFITERDACNRVGGGIALRGSQGWEVKSPAKANETMSMNGSV